MAISSNNLLGATRKTVGEITFQYYKQKQIFKRANRNPIQRNSSAQITQRNAIKEVNDFIKTNSIFIKEYCKSLEINTTIQASFISKNVFKIKTNEMQFSTGTLGLIKDFQYAINPIEPFKIKISAEWAKNAKTSDIIVFILIDKSTTIIQQTEITQQNQNVFIVPKYDNVNINNSLMFAFCLRKSTKTAGNTFFLAET